MRLLRVRLVDVRGVDACEVRFAPEGVTVVEAPNEAGKTTLLDAVDVLLDHKDSSNAARVRELQPVDRDVGSTVEVELTVGEYHLTCTKTFNRDRATVLRIYAPVAETLRGAEAHDRLRVILDTDVDLALFGALRFRQGRDLDAVALGGSAVLAARLDAAAGGGGGTDDGGLLERAAAEHARWFTPTGREGRALAAVDEAVERAREEHERLATRLAELEDDVDELATVERELPALRRRRDQELAPALAEATEDAARVAELAGARETRRAEVDAARSVLDAARAARAQRSELVEELGAAEADVTELEDSLEPDAARLQELLRRRDELDAELGAAVEQADRRRAEQERAGLRVELLLARRERDRLAGRHERATALSEAAEGARRALAELRVDDDGLAVIRRAAEDLRVARAGLAASAPSVRVRAEREVEVLVDDEPRTLPPGDGHTWPVLDAWRLHVPGLLAVEVTAGATADELARAVSEAERALAAACRRVGVADPDEAEELAAARRDHLDALERHQAELARELDGVGVDELAAERRVAEDRVAALEGQLGDEPLPADPARARAELDAARTAADEADAAVARARSAFAEVTELAGEQRTAVEVRRSRLDARQADRARLSQRLAEARAATQDDELTERVARSEGRLADARDALAAAERELAARDPEAVGLARDNLQKQLEDTSARIREFEQREAALRAGLSVRGEEGLGEQLQDAAARLERAEADRRRTRARARAAALLTEELRAARDAAYRAYRAPLRELISRQARLVFGGDVEVELDGELRIVSRTLDGTTLAWDRLSAGAREQLAVLAALAAARLAGPDGVPFVLDDALGYTDPVRLERLGAVLGRTRDAQVIVLTCVADRFRHVGGATTVRLREARGSGGHEAPQPRSEEVAAPGPDGDAG